MARLKNEQAEQDALRIAKILIKHGKEKALLAFEQISKRVNLKKWEAGVLSNRVRELVSEMEK